MKHGKIPPHCYALLAETIHTIITDAWLTDDFEEWVFTPEFPIAPGQRVILYPEKDPFPEIQETKSGRSYVLAECVKTQNDDTNLWGVRFYANDRQVFRRIGW